MYCRLLARAIVVLNNANLKEIKVFKRDGTESHIMKKPAQLPETVATLFKTMPDHLMKPEYQNRYCHF